MRERYSKGMAAILVTIILMGMLASCGSTQPKETSADKPVQKEKTKEDEKKGTDAVNEGVTAERITFPLAEPVTMSMFAVAAGYTGAELPTVLAFQETEKNTNVHWEVTSCLPADLGDKRGLLLSSGDYPDVLFKSFLTHKEIEKYGQQGVLIPLNHLIDQYMPNLKKLLDEKDGWQYITSGDGNIYALPELKKKGIATILFWQNNRWLEAVGMKEPTNMEEFYEVLKAFKEKDPNGNGIADEIPFEANNSVPPIYLYQYLQAMDFNTFCAVDDNDQIVYVPRTETYKEFLSWLSKFYKEGLLDKNCFSQTIDQQYAQGPSDVYGYFYSWSPSETVGATLSQGYDYTVLSPWGKNSVSATSGFSEGGMAITDKCKTPEIAAAWADQFYSEEGGILAVMGIEGKTWRWREDGKWEYMVGTEYGEDESTVRDNTTLQGSAYAPMAWPQVYFKEEYHDASNVSGSLEEDRISETCGKPFPAIQLTEKDSKRTAEITTDISDYINEYMAQVVTGKTTIEESWDSYLKQLDVMGGKEYEDIYNNAYQSMK